MRWISLSICLLFITGVVNAQDEVVVPFAQAGLNAIFMVDAAANRTTAMYSFSYTAPPDDAIRWVLPLPPGSASVRLENSDIVRYAEILTEPDIEPPQKPCELSPKFSFAVGVVPGPYYYGSVNEMLTVFNQINEVQAFVADGGFSLNAEATSAMDSYAEQGYSFAGLTVSPDRAASGPPRADDMGRSTDVYLSPLVVAEYSGTEPILPLSFLPSNIATHFDGYDVESTMPVTAYVFADIPYKSANVGSFQPDLTQMRLRENELANTMRLIDSGGPFENELDYAYYNLARQDIAEMGGLAFALEFVGQANSANRYAAVNEEDQSKLDSFNHHWANYPVLTRLRTFIHADQVVPDVVFIPNPDQANVRLSLGTAIDSVWYWGCTSRRLYDPVLEARLPTGRTYIEDLRLSLAHPQGWQLSVLDYDQSHIYVVSPETVTVDDLGRMESGRGGPPMLVAKAVQTRYDAESYCDLLDPTWGRITGNTEGLPQHDPARKRFTIIWPSQFIWPSCNETVPIYGVRVELVSSFADWGANEALYNDMLAYAGTYQFYLSAGLRHTLFLKQLWYPVALGYPEGWLEDGSVDGDWVLMPAGAVYADAPAARIRSIYPKDEAPATLEAWYGLTEALDLSMDQLIPFETDERRGYVVWLAGSEMPTLEFSAPIAQFAEYADLLRLMASAVRTEWGESPELR